MDDIIPSFYDTVQVGELPFYDGLAFNNTMLRVGEVKRVVYPEDPESRSARFIEYDVWVLHRENGTAVNRMYNGCCLINSLAGFGDYSFWTLRPDAPTNTYPSDSLSQLLRERDEKGVSDGDSLTKLLNARQKGATPATAKVSKNVEIGVGSKVVILCINGENASPLILGGIRDSRSTDIGRKAKGVHAEFSFNGVKFSVNDDGSWGIENLGKTTADGRMDGKADADGAGTTIRVEANGNLEIHTPGKKQKILIDHKAGTIEIDAEKDLTLKSNKIQIGEGADEHMVCGDSLVKVLGDLIDEIALETHGAPGGATSTPLNAVKYRAIKNRLKTVLSNFIFVKKKKP